MNYNFNSYNGNNQNMNYQNGNNGQIPNNKKNGIIVIVLCIIVVCVFGYFKFVKSSNGNSQNENYSTTETDYKTSNDKTGRVDSNTNLTYDKTGAFLMTVDDVFIVSGNTAVTGTIDRGTVKVGDPLQILGLNHEIMTTIVVGIEISQNKTDVAEIGDKVKIMLKDIPREEVKIGQALVQPDSIVAATKFDTDVYVYTKEEGGRFNPFFSGFRPQFYFRVIDITGTIKLPSEDQIVYPGDHVKFTVELESTVVMEVGMEFVIREGGRVVGKGTVTKIY